MYGPPYGNPQGQYLGPTQQLSDPRFLEYIMCQAITREQCLTEANRVIDRLQFQLNKELQSEQEYQRTMEQNGCTVTWDKRGRTHVILNDSIDSVLLIVPDPLLGMPSWYLVSLRRTGQTVVIWNQEFENDFKFLHKFQLLPGVEVHNAKTQRRTAQLLRSEIYKVLKSINLPFYAGWQPSDAGYSFGTFPCGTTHQCFPQIDFLAPHSEPVTATDATVAAFQFWDVFSVLEDGFSRKIIFLIFHESVLHTLLEHIGYKVPLAFAFFSDDSEQTTYLKHLFSWRGDSVLSPDENPQHISWSLVTPKDQPILVVDSGRLNNRAKTMNILEDALVNGTVSMKIGQGEKAFPLQGPIIIISDRISALTVAPEVMVLDIPPGSFERKFWLEIADSVSENRDYLRGFISFTESRTAELQQALKQGRKRALELSEGELNDRCVETLGVFLGLDIFLGEFFKHCSSVITPVVQFDEATEVKLVELLRQATDKELHTSLADQFLMVGRKQIERGKVQTYSKDHAPKTVEGSIVFYDWDYLYFNSTAFFQVCDALSQSRPAVLKSLAEAGLFGGRQVNATTAQTRITVCNVYGQRQSIKVYAVCRAAFDEIRIGDPLILDGEDQL